MVLQRGLFMSAINELSNDLKELQVDFGSQSFTWGGSSYLCTPTGLEDLTEVDLGGNVAKVTLALLVRNASFSGAAPAYGDRITFDGETLIVVSAVRHHGVYTKLILAEVNR